MFMEGGSALVSTRSDEGFRFLLVPHPSNVPTNRRAIEQSWMILFFFIGSLPDDLGRGEDEELLVGPGLGPVLKEPSEHGDLGEEREAALGDALVGHENAPDDGRGSVANFED